MKFDVHEEGCPSREYKWRKHMTFNWENAFNKTLLSCVAVLGLSASLDASTCGTKTCKEKPHFAFAYPKDLNLANPYDFYFYVEGLAFQGMESGLDFVIVNSAVPSSSSIVHGKLGGFGQDESWDYNFGMRLGWGLYLDHDAWNFDFDWTWVNVTNAEDYEAKSGSTLPIWLADNGNGTSPYSAYGTSGATWDLPLTFLMRL